MPDYRRFLVPGGTYFFTINLLERYSDLLVRHIDALREAVRRTRRERPFRIDAWVVLPEYMDYVHFNPVKHGYVTFSSPVIVVTNRYCPSSSRCAIKTRSSGQMSQ